MKKYRKLLSSQHKNQKYENLPYFTHFLRVAETVVGPTEDELVADMLHDVLEDTDATYEEVTNEFGKNVADIIQLLTKDASLSYIQNIHRIIASGNRSAMKVKWADNEVNMNGDKSHMTIERADKLTKRYAKSFAALSRALEG